MGRLVWSPKECVESGSGVDFDGYACSSLMGA